MAPNKHVLCEKPFAADTAEATKVFDAAESAGIVQLLGTEFRWATSMRSVSPPPKAERSQSAIHDQQVDGAERDVTKRFGNRAHDVEAE